MQTLVLDTNIVLDVWVFGDPATVPLKAALESDALHWLATAAMREELQRVLGYPKIARRAAFHGVAAADVLARFDRHARLHPVAPKAPVTCKDPDDQKFIDLAVAHRASLASKDHAVLCMAKRLVVLGVRTSIATDFVA